MLELSVELAHLRAQRRYIVFVLPAIIVLHNAAHNAVFRRWDAYQMYNERTLPDVIMSSTSLHVGKTANGVRIGTFVMMAVTGVGCLFYKSEHSAVLLVRKFIAVYAASSLLRCLTFFVTLLPATAPYCLAKSLGGTYVPHTAPRTWHDVFWVYNWTHACGDLLFSGHTILMVCMWLVIERVFYGYWTRFATAKNAHARMWVIAQVFAVYGARVKLVLFLFNTVKARKHYTIDVVVALYVTTLLWFVIAQHLPTTVQPDVVCKRKDVHTLRKELRSV